MNVELHAAAEKDLSILLPFVREFHEIEDVTLADSVREASVRALIETDSLGRIWLIKCDGIPMGYIAICFGYSIEFCGRDGFIDEIFIREDYRGRGIGRVALEIAKSEVASLGVKALHLEVARNNDRARKLYAASGFLAREKYHLMSCSLRQDEA